MALEFRGARRSSCFNGSRSATRDFFRSLKAFLPERWTEEFSNSLPKYAYFPFGGGPRTCIGNYFAMMEIVLLLATIGQRFRFSLAPDHEVSLMPAMSLRPRDGIKVVAGKR